MRRDTEVLVDVIDEFMPGFGSAFAARCRADLGQISNTEATSAIRAIVRRNQEREAKQRAEEMNGAAAKVLKDAAKRQRLPLGVL